VLGLRRSQSHPVADKRIEHSAQKREHGCEPFPDLLCLMRNAECDRGHRDLLANPMDIIVSTTP
jgi:hypothetical protein